MNELTTEQFNEAVKLAKSLDPFLFQKLKGFPISYLEQQDVVGGLCIHWLIYNYHTYANAPRFPDIPLINHLRLCLCPNSEINHLWWRGKSKNDRIPFLSILEAVLNSVEGDA